MGFADEDLAGEGEVREVGGDIPGGEEGGGMGGEEVGWEQSVEIDFITYRLG